MPVILKPLISVKRMVPVGVVVSPAIAESAVLRTTIFSVLTSLPRFKSTPAPASNSV